MGKSSNGDLNKADRSTAFAGLMTKAGRREFLRGLGFGAAGAATLGAVGLASTTPAKAANIDAEILTFALNLEYLEAEFYSLAALGEEAPPKPNRPQPRTDHGGISCTLPRACPHLSQASAQTSCNAARKLRAVFS